LNSAGATLQEAYRVLRKKVPIILRFLDPMSSLGKQYPAKRAVSTV
jgi:hypothetical protein